MDFSILEKWIKKDFKKQSTLQVDAVKKLKRSNMDEKKKLVTIVNLLDGKLVKELHRILLWTIL